MDELSILKNKKILEVLKDEDNYLLKFVTDWGDFKFQAYGDCCSKSWFESFDNLENLIGEVVLDVIEKDENKNDETLEDGDVIRFYSFTFKTPKGYADLEMRNSSNGYYGGSIERVLGAADTAFMPWGKPKEERLSE